MKILAITCIRNEEVHIRRCLSDLTDDGIEVILINNDSEDNSAKIAEEFSGKGLLEIKRLPFNGKFSLPEVLKIKNEIIQSSQHDWIIHIDADERLCSSVKGQSLREGIIEADSKGYNCINFHEIVFVPLPGENFDHPDYADEMKNYYFFQPCYPRLNRAWRRDSLLSNERGGGHYVKGDNVKLSPIDFYLRHYIMLSEEQGRRKYLGRVFASDGLKRGWHRNRIIISEENLKVRERPELMSLKDPAGNDFDLSRPLKEHFWMWHESLNPEK